MTNQPNRRDVLKLSALALAAMAGTRTWAADAAPSATRKKVLFFTKSSGFQHSVITRPAENPTKLAYAEQILTDLAAQHGFEVTCSKDGNVFAPGSIERFDVFVFYTTGDLTSDSDKYAMVKGPDGKNVPDPNKLLWCEPAMPAGSKEAFLHTIAAGKGFLGLHSASDTFHSKAYAKGAGNLLRDVDEKGSDVFDPYIQMLGGEFIIHGKQQEATLKTIDSAFPGASDFDKARFVEEWYSLKNFSPDLHVILAQETAGMTGPMYARGTYPQTWARMHGKGRVFYTSMGHREDVWQKPEFQNLIAGALKWTSGQVEADVTPNLKTATPEAEQTK